MARLILLILIVIGVWYAWQKIKASSKGDKRKQIFFITLMGAAAVVVLLAISGRLHWVGATVLLILPVLGRLLNQLTRLMPWLAPYLSVTHATGKTRIHNKNRKLSRNIKPHRPTRGRH